MKHLDWGLGLILGILLLSQLYAGLQPSTPIRDAEEYAWAAQNMAETGHWYAGDPQEMDMRLHSKRPPLYPFFLLISNVFGPWGWRIFQLILVALLYVSGKALLGLSHQLVSGRVYHWLFVLGLPLFFTSTFQLADLLLAVILCQMMYYGILYWRNGRSADAWILAILWSLALLCKPVMLPSIFLIPILLLFQKRPWQGQYALGLPFLIVVLLVAYNHQKTGVYHYSSISTINRTFYNARLTISAVYGSDSAVAYTDHPDFAIPQSKSEFKAYRDALNARSNQTLMEHPGAYARIHVLGMIKGLLDPGRFELYTYYRVPESEDGLTMHLWSGNWPEVKTYFASTPYVSGLFVLLLLVQLFKIVAVACSWRSWRTDGLLYVLTALYFLLLAGPIGAYRFLLPAYVPLLLLATFGLSRFPFFLKKGSKSKDVLSE